MKRLSLVILTSLMGTATAMDGPVTTPAACRAFGYNSKACDKHQGFYPNNGVYLEGVGLETLHFVASTGHLTAFPPAGGTLLKAVKPCGKAPLVPDVKVTSCRVTGKSATRCAVHFLGNANVCTTKYGEKGNGDQVLFAVPGYWDGTGAWQDDPSSITLACDVPDPNGLPGSVNSAVGTCINGHYSLDATEPSSRQQFLACVRAVRADYCGDGTPHTRTGTPIGIHDQLINPMRQDWCADGKDPDGLDYEATWSPDGVICFFHDRWTGKGLSDDACNTKIKTTTCQANDPRAIMSTLWL